MEKKGHKGGSGKKEHIEKQMIENFVSLQKVLTNLAIKFDSLSENIFKLLQLFEISAKTFVEKETPELGEKKKDREFLDKLDRLLEQNKVIAKGLTLMEEKLKERIYGNKPEVEGIIGENFKKPFAPQNPPAPFPRMPANVEGRPGSPEGRPRYPKSPGYPSF